MNTFQASTVLLMFIALEASIIITFLVVFIAFNKKINELHTWYSMIFNKLTEAYYGLSSIDEKRQEVYKKIIESDKKMDEAFIKHIETDEKIVEAWKQIADGLKESTKVNNDIMNAWYDVEENYSMAYEEYRLCLEKLEALDKANADIYAKLNEIDEHTKPIDIFVMPTFGDMYEEKEDDE